MNLAPGAVSTKFWGNKVLCCGCQLVASQWLTADEVLPRCAHHSMNRAVQTPCNRTTGRHAGYTFPIGASAVLLLAGAHACSRA